MCADDTTPAALPDIDTLWDYQDPAATEDAFRALLPEARAAGDTAYEAELLTQIARAQGLQQHFDAALATLDAADALLIPTMPRVRVRALLERGRVINSSGDPEASVSSFEQALELAIGEGLDAYAVDAAHMLGIVCTGEASIAWNERALALAEGSEDRRARRWLGALYNNLGWTYHDLGRHDAALEVFERHLEVRRAQDNAVQVGIALWSIGKTQRFMGHVEEALELQRALLQRAERSDNAAEGYTHEEIGECLLLLEREDEAASHFARAWALLRDDPWLGRDEPQRLERMRRLGGMEPGG